MDVFDLRDHVVREYRGYVEGFLNIADIRVRDFVLEHLNRETLWPEPLVQLNPAYEQGRHVQDLVDEGQLHPLCARIFPFRLYRHQEEAILRGIQGRHFVVSSGTGSGKSLTYWIPIIDFILKNSPQEEGVRAIIVYPMNALANSQLDSIRRHLARDPEAQRLIRVRRFTGQETFEEKEQIREHPPQILLTNYVMLEYLLTRPEDRRFLQRTLTSQVAFLVVDELHTYRGRQGADVALLLRRVRARCGNPYLTCIGTSATIATGATRAERRGRIAEVASRLFGVTVSPDDVIEEHLRRLTDGTTVNSEEVRQSVTAALPQGDPAELRTNPLFRWVESAFGVETEEGGILRRRTPITLTEGASRLSQETGHPLALCRERLKEAFRIGSQAVLPDSAEGLPLFAFKLHQFISQSGSVHATLQLPSERRLTLAGQVYGERDGSALFYPLLFCRVCGQDFYQVVWDRQANRLLPVHPFAPLDEEGEERTGGYFLLDDGQEVWSGELEDLPDNWFRRTARGLKLDRRYEPFVPERLTVRPDGSVTADSGAVGGWFLKRPLLFCPNCGEVYTLRDKDDWRKLSRISSEGRSSATTVLSIAVVDGMRRDEATPTSARKLLAFTDNRQDAALQAGHLNDFVTTVRVRAALLRATQESGGLSQDTLPERVFQAIELPQEEYARFPAERGPLRQRNEEALRRLLEFRVYEDLRRGWRITLPNLEQCGLVRIDYEGLTGVCADDRFWARHPLLAGLGPPQREAIVRSLLDYMRENLAVRAHCLQAEAQSRLRRQAVEVLKDPWSVDESENLRQASVFVEPGLRADRAENEMSLSERSRAGLFLRRADLWGRRDKLTRDEYLELMRALLETLQEGGFLIKVTSPGGQPGFQVRSDCLRWMPGDGRVPEPSPLRSRRLPGRAVVERARNVYFQELYRRAADLLRELEAREHTAQVPYERRQEREQRFREGVLPLLYCSPTMELGIDIADLLATFHRNVPPSPTNYVQRAGRAGRGGRPALVVTFCAVGSGHDQFFFRHPEQMVSGVLEPPRLDLSGEDLIRDHVHAIWLGRVGLPLKAVSADAFLELDVPGYPLRSDVRTAIHLSDDGVREVLGECEQVLGTCPDLRTVNWYSGEWLQEVVRKAPDKFDRAWHRWRELYSAAQRQWEEANQALKHPKADKRSLQRYEHLQREAQRQKEILLGRGINREEADFYPYRYLATEGFLPGYNFPRLPLRAFVPIGEGEFISRPRFLAITEFGPRNIVYHEGQKFRIIRAILGPQAAEDRVSEAKVCRTCGYLSAAYELSNDLCNRCGASLADGEGAYRFGNLFRMTDMASMRTERIYCDEEERLRYGYRVTIHYRFAPAGGGHRVQEAAAKTNEGEPLLRLTYGPTASLWWINHGWRRARQPGFTLNTRDGYWTKRPDDPTDLDPQGEEGSERLVGIRLYVEDTKNILLVRPSTDLPEDELATLQYALQKGMAAFFKCGRRRDRQRAGRRGLVAVSSLLGGCRRWPWCLPLLG
jgi:superfamily II DNA or RNA helicase